MTRRTRSTVHGIHAAAPRLTLTAAAVLAALTCLPLLMLVALR
jgi:preprotein translocase subunit SecY